VKFKLDENLGAIGQQILIADGHDVMTVSEQSLGGAADEFLFGICCDERRALVRLDQDFAQTLRFAPERSSGIIVLRIGGRLSPSKIELCMRTLMHFAKSNDPTHSLWIIEPGRVRVHD
jgi:predicted nuclease of predicted toxin-antitoxin system